MTRHSTLVVDANYILRWFLNDIPDQAQIADKLFTTADPAKIIIDRVTIAEVTYVLRSKHYDHRQIFQIFEELYYYPTIKRPGKLSKAALILFRDNNLDFEDCILIAYHNIHGHAVGSFDKKLLKLLN